ncbi:MAG TPA: hypothetical protein VGZ02_04990 [Candidatus Baltobacteraceae bacterium]|jgi:hypothetical protein|nr:hypothetical protein [Candidatus Baltobacteraceae bacterium]
MLVPFIVSAIFVVSSVPDSPGPAPTACAIPVADPKVADDDAFENFNAAIMHDFGSGTATSAKFVIEVSADGKETGIRVDGSSDGSVNISKGQATVNAAKSLHFIPKMVNCKPVDGEYFLQVNLSH